MPIRMAKACRACCTMPSTPVSWALVPLLTAMVKLSVIPGTRNVASGL